MGVTYVTVKVKPLAGSKKSLEVALESTGIGVDPVTRTLERMAAKPLK